MVGEHVNVHVVQQVPGAPGRGDIPAVLSMMTDDIHIHLPGPSEIPFAGSYRGHEGVGRFFQAIGTHAEVRHFEPREFIVQADEVVVLRREQLTAKATGRSWETDWAMVSTLRNGKIARLREFHETGSIAAAFRP
jgi:uncharacterized protein